MELPQNYRLQYSREQIQEQVVRLGREITAWASQVWKETERDVLGIPVLRGGIFFFTDLVREIDHSVHCAPVRTWAYEIDQTQVLRDTVRVEMKDASPAGQSVLLIDDICDSGRTLAALKKAFLDAGAAEVRSAVLIKRILEEETFNPDYVGMEYTGQEWFVGYGMEDCERWRNLGSIYIIEQE